MSLLTVQGLSKSFKELRVLMDVSLTVEDGERHVIIGPNGAGKTTLFNGIMGFLSMDSGTVTVGEKQISGLPPHSRVHLGMSCTFQKNNLFGDLTVRENLELAVAARKPYRFRIFKPLSWRADLQEETDKLLEQWDLQERHDSKVKQLSYGEQRLLEIVLALASEPRILLLDEPTSGMSPAETSQTVRLIQSLPASISLLVIEHDMDVVFSIADNITVLHHGEVFLNGPPEQIRGDARVREIYFGGGSVSDA